jgi:putative membrane protein
MDLRLLYLTIHVVGFVTWVGSLFGFASILGARGRESDPAFAVKLGAVAKDSGRAMDVGATLAIAGGLGLLSSNFAGYMQQPWLHAKLTLVLLLLGAHGFLRAKGKRGGAIPKALVPAVTLIAVTIISLVVFKPGAR